jgi:hypothetical protein
MILNGENIFIMTTTNKTLYPIKVIDNVHYYTTNEADPDDEWSRDSTDESHSIEGIKLSARYGDVETTFKPEKGVSYYLLYYIYSTGDSFGSDSGRIHFIGLYRSKQLADKCAKLIDKGGVNVTIYDDNGTPYKEHISARDDYFGGLTSVEVAEVSLI